MSKDCRIVVRMSEELRAWVNAQASAREIDDASYVRMVLAEQRSGIAATQMKAATPVPAAAPLTFTRDVLDVASDNFGRAPAMDLLPELGEYNAEMAGDLAAEEQRRNGGEMLDIDAIVQQQLEDAEANGLTMRQVEESQGDMPSAGVRNIGRRIPPPYSPGTQPRHLAQL